MSMMTRHHVALVTCILIVFMPVCINGFWYGANYWNDRYGDLGIEYATGVYDEICDTIKRNESHVEDFQL